MATAAAIATLCMIVKLYNLPPSSLAFRKVGNQTTSLVLTRVGSGDAALLDKTPLFLPTEWNTARKEVRLPEAGEAFAPYTAKPRFPEGEFRVGLTILFSEPVLAAQVASAALVDESLIGLGRKDIIAERLTPRSAFVDVASAGDGRRIFAEPLILTSMPSADGWQPLECLAAIDAAGLVSLDLISRSGFEEIDAYFCRYLMQNLKLGARLKPGFYRVNVGP